MNSDLLDKYCRLAFGHTDWEISYEGGDIVITMYEVPRDGYEQEEFLTEEGEE